MVRHCVVIGCTSDSRTDKNIKFFKFPGALKRKNVRDKWIDNVYRKCPNGTRWTPKDYDVVCAKHFLESAPTPQHPVPYLNMGHRYAKKQLCRQALIRTPVVPATSITMPDISDDQSPANTTDIPERTTENLPPAPQTFQLQDQLQDQLHHKSPSKSLCLDNLPFTPPTASTPEKPDFAHSPRKGEDSLQLSYLFSEDCDHHQSLAFHTYSKPTADVDDGNTAQGDNGNVDEIRQLTCQVKRLKSQVMHLKQRLANKQKDGQFSYRVIIGDDAKTRQFTGFPSYQCFVTVFEKRIKPRAQQLSMNTRKARWSWYERRYKSKPGPERRMALIDEFFLVMVRLRLGLLESDLAERFSIHKQQVSKILSSWLPCLAKCLKKLVKMPSKEQVQKHMPKAFRVYPKTRVIIDCTEVFIERPTTLLARQQTWSTYKHHNTAKSLVGISPEGAITFLSKMWGGRASDKHIVRNSGFLDTLEPYDEVMADRGFDIAAELAERSCTLNIPPFTKGKSQLSRAEVERHRRISSLRIHVERAIERLKNFRILQGIFPLNHIHMIDDVQLVCAAVVNMWPPIIS